MHVRTLIEDFITLCIHGANRNAYERLYPALFDHYYRYWCPRERRLADVGESELRVRSKRVKQAIGSAEAIMRTGRIDLSTMRVVLFVGGNTSNGHAFFDGDQVVVWLPGEAYTSDLLARIFVIHEIIHGLHYEASPGYYFHNESSKA